MEYSHISVRRISGSLGAEIDGVDLSERLPDEVIAEIRHAWLEHLVIFFRDQDLTPAQQLALAERFGEPVEYPWVSDTLFANCHAAYETLSDGLKATLEPLIGVNTSAKQRTADTRADRVADAPKEDVRTPRVAEHPVVRVHPETGRQSLYVSYAHTTRFKGWTEAESKPLLDFLFEHQTLPEFTCRFRWEPGSLALWDNRCALHNPIKDYHGHRRPLRRITFAGDETAGA